MPLTGEKYNAWKRAWYKENRQKELERKKKYHSTPEGKAVINKAVKKYREKFPERQLAREAVQRRVKRGRIVPSVCACGATKTQAHHPDYSKPLEVEWLCSGCHAKKHHS